MDENQISYTEIDKEIEDRAAAKRHKLPHEIFDFAELLLIVLAVLLLATTFLFRQTVVIGGSMNPTLREGEIDAPIARMPLPSLLRKIDAQGKPSLTRYRVLEEFSGYSRLWLRPVTGRTHQLRLHCAHIGHPILGDPQYGTEASQALSMEMGLTTQSLCAVSLQFPHPITGEKMEISTCISR